MIDTLKLKVEKIPFSDTASFSSIFLDYVDQHPKLRDLAGPFPSIKAFDDAIKNRDFPGDRRDTLVKALNQQYDGLVLSGKLVKNINSLKQKNSFTITTGHQLNIFTGPLFFIYKIVTTLRACEVLHSHYPVYNFIPVYWMASEDHDFEEINHINLFGQEYRWETNSKGPVGRFALDGLGELAETIRDCPDCFLKAYKENQTLAGATRQVVNELFGDHGLVVLDADHTELKREFIPVMKTELIQQPSIEQVDQASAKLEQLGYKTLVTPRDINLFYLKDGLRERIVKQGDHWQVLETDLSFDEDQLLEELQQHPDRFSPNVIMRTLYQETILPNLAYVGGPGELAYWMQFKSTFDYFDIPFPILIPRNSALMVIKSLVQKIEKLELEPVELFMDPHTLKSSFISRNSDATLELKHQQKQIQEVFQQLVEKVKSIDGSLTGYIKAEENKVLKNLEQIEKRLKKAEEHNQEIAVKQLLNLKDKLFPEGGLQERQQNFLNFYINNPEFIEDLMEILDPFDFNFYLLFENG